MHPSVTVDNDNGVVVAHLRGEIDLANAREIGASVAAVVRNDSLGLVLDLTGMTYLDSSGVQLVFDLAERLRRRQQEICLSVPAGAPIRRVLDVVQLDSTVPVVPSPEEAVAKVRAQHGS